MGFCLVVLALTEKECFRRFSLEARVVYHLPQIPGNFCWDVNGKFTIYIPTGLNPFLVRPTGKFPGQTEILESYSLFSRLGRSK